METVIKNTTYKDISHVNDFVCTNHDDIKLLCEEVFHILAVNEVRSNKDTSSNTQIASLISVILDRAKQAKYQGIKMEKRLRKYRKAIERLGFVRVNKHNV